LNASKNNDPYLSGFRFGIFYQTLFNYFYLSQKKNKKLVFCAIKAIKNQNTNTGASK